MRISPSKPLIWDEASKLFDITEKSPVVFTYGDVLYNPARIPVSADLLKHEEIHAEQQEHNETVAKIWWQRYFIDPDFRIEQEAEAYGEQYKFLCRIYKDRNQRARMLNQLAAFLAGPVYGKCIGLLEATEKIKSYADGTFMKEIEKGLGEAGEI